MLILVDMQAKNKEENVKKKKDRKLKTLEGVINDDIFDFQMCPCKSGLEATISRCFIP